MTGTALDAAFETRIEVQVRERASQEREREKRRESTARRQGKGPEQQVSDRVSGD